MKVLKATTMGFCNGVSFAIGQVDSCLALAAERGVPAYSYGAFIHNQQVMEAFERKGLRIIDGPEGHAPGCVVIRAHGVSDAVRRAFNSAGFILVDGTCPTVARSQRMIRKAGMEGLHVVIISLHGHHETLALAGCELQPGRVVPSTVVERPEDLERVPDGVPLFVMIQTTFPEAESKVMYAAIASRFQDRKVVVGNRICPSSTVRRNAVVRLCEFCDAVVVVGSPQSANTQALGKIAENRGAAVYMIETVDELTDELRRYRCVGLTAGASSPEDVIGAVEDRLNRM